MRRTVPLLAVLCALFLTAPPPLLARTSRIRSGTASSIPARMGELPLGKQPPEIPVMTELDAVAGGWGAGEGWTRWVRHLSNIPFDSPASRADTSGEYAVVAYRPRSSKTRGAERFEIWVDRFDRRFWVVPQALQRAADRFVLDRGYNLREYTVTPEWRENRLFFTYNLAPYDPLTGEQREFEDGQMAVRTDREGRRIERCLLFWDGGREDASDGTERHVQVPPCPNRQRFPLLEGPPRRTGVLTCGSY